MSDPSPAPVVAQAAVAVGPVVDLPPVALVAPPAPAPAPSPVFALDLQYAASITALAVAIHAQGIDAEAYAKLKSLVKDAEAAPSALWSGIKAGSSATGSFLKSNGVVLVVAGVAAAALALQLVPALKALL